MKSSVRVKAHGGERRDATRICLPVSVDLKAVVPEQMRMRDGTALDERLDISGNGGFCKLKASG